MEFDELEYTKTPFNTTKLFEIHTLSSNGFSKYISNDSYTHKYLEQKVPKSDRNRENIYFSTSKNKIFSKRKSMSDEIQEEVENCLLKGNMEEEKTKLESKNEKDQFKDEDQILKEEIKIYNGKEEEIKNEENKVNKKNSNKANKYHSYSEKDLKQLITQAYFHKPNINNNDPTSKTKYVHENNNSYKNLNPYRELKLSLLSKEMNNDNLNANNLKDNSIKFKFNTIYNNKNLSNKSINKAFSPSLFTSKSSSLKTDYQKNFSISTEKSFYYKKSNLDPLSRRLQITSSNFKPTLNTELTKNTNSRFDKNYLLNLNLLIKSKSYFQMDKLVETDNSIKKGYDGFEFSNIPHIENTYSNEVNDNRKKFRKPIRVLAEKIAKSCLGNKKTTFDLSQTESKIKEAQEESEKLKKIIMTQTNSDFLRKTKLPEIQSCVEQPKLKIHKSSMQEGKIKHMGERYNPYNFQAGRDCETNRRNLTGALFQH